MSKKKVKINGKWVVVDEKDVQDEDAKTEDEKDEDEDKEDDEDADDAKLMDKAAKIGKRIAKEINEGNTVKVNSEWEAKMSKIVDSHYGVDSKLKAILNGKSIDGSDLTKDEKIVGFFHATVTNNQQAMKALAEGVDADGGYLVPHELFTEIVTDLPEINIMRDVVRVIPMKRHKIDITNLVDGVDVFWTGENAVKSTTTARLTQQTLTAFKLAAIMYSSDELIEDSTEADIVDLIVGLFTDAIGEEEERVIFVGNGTTQPQGIETARAAGTIPTLVGGGSSITNINRLYRALPRKYRVNAKWLMNDETAGNIDQLADTTGRPMWSTGLADGAPDRLKGKEVIISDWAPNRTVFFGDWKRAYFLGDRKRITVKVSQDTETAFTKDQTAIRVVSRIGGRVVLGAAARAMTSF